MGAVLRRVRPHALADREEQVLSLRIEGDDAARLTAAIAVALIAFGGSFAVTAALLVLWGLLATSAPVGWWTWLSRTLPHDAEAGGGLMVAVVQLAITLGAVVGGLLFDASGYQSTFTASAVILLVAAVLAALTSRKDRAAA
ncbi:hypothetical protein ACDP63_15580 [Paracoccus sp. P2]|uniref:hypothetical protein n=1 Tax=Paracoccus sp. P2 TaxID=3248840 RepID=UPI00391EF123